MIFRLGGCASGAEVPSLSHDLMERLTGVWRPTQNVLLGSLGDVLLEIQADPAEPLRMRKEKSDRLLAWDSGAPARTFTGQQCRLDGMHGVFRGDFHLRQTLDS